MKKHTMRYCGIMMMVACATFANVQAAEQPAGEAKAIASQTITLDGPDWKIATDPNNKGRDEKWFEAPRPEAKPATVPCLWLRPISWGPPTSTPVPKDSRTVFITA